MIISVIIPVFNESENITTCLHSLLRQTYKPVEIICIDDGSVDNSADLIAKIAQHNPSIRMYQKKHAGPAEARNYGSHMAKGKILVFIDADMHVADDFIEKITDPIISKKEIATFTRSEFVANLDNTWAKMWDEVTFGNAGRRRAKDQKKRGSVARAIAKEAFIMSGGFLSRGYTDDSTVLERLGKTALAVDGAISYHHNPTSLSEIFRSSRWMGRDPAITKTPITFLRLFPLWSLYKGIIGGIRFRQWNYILFRVVFDFGYLCGIIDNWVFSVHHK